MAFSKYHVKTIYNENFEKAGMRCEQEIKSSQIVLFMRMMRRVMDGASLRLLNSLAGQMMGGACTPCTRAWITFAVVQISL